MDTVIDTLNPPVRREQTAGERKTLAPEVKTPARRRARALAYAGAGALVLAAAATSVFFHYQGRVSTDDAQVDAHIAPIAPKIAGTIAEILVDDNQPVKTGQVLLRIDPRDYEARVAQAKAALAAAQSQSAGADAGVPLTTSTTSSAVASAEAQLAAATADLTRARADYDRASSSEVAYANADVESKRATADRARSDLTRMQPLAAKDEISKQQFDAFIAAARVAESELRASEEKLANAQKQVQSSGASVEAAQARTEVAKAALQQAMANRRQVDISAAQAGSASAAILQARANLEAAQLELSYSTIVAPIDGVVTRKSVQLGQIVQPGQSLLTIVPLADVWVTANFKETQLAGVRPGQRAEVHVDMYGQSFEGRVHSVAGATGSKLSLLPPENATGNFVKIVQRIPVKIALDHLPDGITFRPGMNVNATIFTK
ncbi:MAG TPA: HlyD family secretion protein [Vicinamibacterales bacterium]|nr:HlyD family secretion protein [Vicinamibacterales bacterium]